MNTLIGYSGLLGKTLQDYYDFDFVFNSKNIEEFRQIPNGTNAYLTCLPATKWLVNKEPEKDMQLIMSLIELFKTKKFNNIYLFSTIDVYCDSPCGVDESFIPNLIGLNYGSNRYRFERMILNSLEYNELKILRLPALFGKYIKKNVIFDLLNNNQVDNINLNSRFQWYDLSNLQKDIKMCSDRKETLFNLFPEPIETIELVKMFPQYQLNRFDKRIDYDYRTKYTNSGYTSTKEDVLNQIKTFVENYEHLRKSTQSS